MANWTTSHLDLPRSLGPYTLSRRIAVGGMAEVYVGKAKGVGGFEKLVAIKVIHPRHVEDPHFVQLLVEEAKISVLLTHNNIVQIFDLSHVDDTYFIVMEYIDGADAQRITRLAQSQARSLPISFGVFMMAEVCNGLGYAHQKKDAKGNFLGIVHRDISPHNVLVTRSGEVKVVDFGIAKAALRSEQTEAGVIKGKYCYMSPEQAWGKELDARSDIFSVGVVLHEMITGQSIYERDSIPVMLDRVRRAQVAPPSTFRKEIPPSLDQIVMRALAPDPDNRYPDAIAFGNELREFLRSYEPSFSSSEVATLVNEILAEEPRDSLLSDGMFAYQDAEAEAEAETSAEAEERSAHAEHATLHFTFDRRSSVLFTGAPEAATQAGHPGEAGTAGVDGAEEATYRESLPASLREELKGGNATPQTIGEVDWDAALPMPDVPASVDAHPRPGSQPLGTPQVEEQQTAPPRTPSSASPPGSARPVVVGADEQRLRGSNFEEELTLEDPLASVSYVPPVADQDEDDNAGEARLATKHSCFGKLMGPGAWRLKSAVVGVLLVIGALVLATLQFSKPAPVLEIISIPQGASVTLNGRAIEGSTPLRIRRGLRPDESYRLQVQKKGFAVWESAFQPSEGTTTQIAVLEALRMSLDISTQPPRAKIWVDGAYFGLSPVKVNDLEPGNHVRIRAELPGYKEASQTLLIDATQPASSIALELEVEEKRRRR